ncbi:MAG TPA: hypothetical protein VI757_12895 [Bacteroidia bacterium]|nr:hypothetical protein [Bacteroidia bacterium]
MASIRIPQSTIPSFIDLLKIDETIFNLVIDFLNDIPLGKTPKEINNSLPENLKNDKRIKSIIELAFSLNMVKVDYDETENKFYDEVCISAMENEKLSAELTTEEEKNKLKKRVASLLEIRNLYLSAKTIMLGAEFGNLFHDVKSITDIRPVFNKEGNNVATLIVNHQLKIIYHGDSEHHELFLNLDKKDLKKLSRVIKRALDKEEAISERLKATGFELTFINK